MMGLVFSGVLVQVFKNKNKGKNRVPKVTEWYDGRETWIPTGVAQPISEYWI